MKLSQLIWVSIAGLAVTAGGIAFAQNGLWLRHPILWAAERHCRQADQDLLRAQQANHWDMHGHAAHAEQLLRQADHEIWAAAQDADHH